MTSAQVVETSVNVISNSPSQDYTHPDDRTLLYDYTYCLTYSDTRNAQGQKNMFSFKFQTMPSWEENRQSSLAFDKKSSSEQKSRNPGNNGEKGKNSL